MPPKVDAWHGALYVKALHYVEVIVNFSLPQLEEALGPLGILLLALVAGLVLHMLVFALLRRLVGRTRVGQSLVRHVRAPLRWLMPVLAVRLSMPAQGLYLPEAVLRYASKALSILLIVAGAWLLIRLARVMEDWVLAHFDINVSDNLRARKIVTQLDIVRKILVFIITVLALAAILMSFDGFRQLGAGLLASAGLAGLVVGFAAQRTLANVLAGFQIALSQPIRIDDVVVVEGEWGRIEEVTLTYVVVKIWDLRRLVLPISYFIEKPFQNWTRTSAEILGTVFLYLDYTVPVEAMRQQLHRLLQASRWWDGKAWALQVTDTKQQTVEIRALMSAADSASAFELRCEIREQLIAWLQAEYPQALPRVRGELSRMQTPGGELGAKDEVG